MVDPRAEHKNLQSKGNLTTMIDHEDIHRLTLLAEEVYQRDVGGAPSSGAGREDKRVVDFSTLSSRINHDHMRAAPVVEPKEEVKQGDVRALSHKWGTIAKWRLKEK